MTPSPRHMIQLTDIFDLLIKIR